MSLVLLTSQIGGSRIFVSEAATMLVKASVCLQLMSCALHLKSSRTHELVLNTTSKVIRCYDYVSVLVHLGH